MSYNIKFIVAKKKKGFTEALEAEVLHETGEYVKDKFRKKAIRIGEMSAAFILGMFLIAIGVALFLESVFPELEGGISFIILGVIFILVGVLLR